jgi:RNA binding exosome subunit
MKETVVMALLVLTAFAGMTSASLLDTIFKDTGSSQKKGGDQGTTVAGLKEALSIGTQNAVTEVSQVNGYFGNKAIKILMPKKLDTVANVLKKVGYSKEVDDFELSMNRAAEKAAPRAKSIFVDAIKEMTIEDARKVLSGGDTAATDYFKDKTHDKLYTAFEPTIASSLDEVGATRSYKTMMAKYESVPFVSKQSLDLDRYVTEKALDGLYYMVGQEEKKIRHDPAARVTDLLRTVFGKQ